MPWPNVTVVHANSFIVNAFSKGMTISAFSMLGIETSKEKEERGSPDHGRRVANSGQPYAWIRCDDHEGRPTAATSPLACCCSGGLRVTPWVVGRG